jgi:hypothetical protein
VSVPERTEAQLRVIDQVIAVAAQEGSLTGRAEALLEPLRGLVPYTGVWISLLDPHHREQPPLVCRGYPDGVADYFGGPSGVAEVERAGLHQDRRAVRISDAGVRLEEVPTWARYLEPAGFRDGLAVGLFTRDGRHLGMLGLHTDVPGQPTPAARDLLTRLAPTIARALDPLRALGAAALIVRGALAGVVLSRTGEALPLPGLPGHPLLRPGSPALRVAGTHPIGQEYATFLCPSRPARVGPPVRITVLNRTSPLPRHLVGAVVVSPPGRLYGLRRIQLEILGHLIEDRPYQGIAAALGVPVAAVAVHAEEIQARLDSPSLPRAVLRALRLGLFIPPALARARS